MAYHVISNNVWCQNALFCLCSARLLTKENVNRFGCCLRVFRAAASPARDVTASGMSADVLSQRDAHPPNHHQKPRTRRAATNTVKQRLETPAELLLHSLHVIRVSTSGKPGRFHAPEAINSPAIAVFGTWVRTRRGHGWAGLGAGLAASPSFRLRPGNDQHGNRRVVSLCYACSNSKQGRGCIWVRGTAASNECWLL